MSHDLSDGGQRILLLGPDSELRGATCELLEQIGHRILSATDPEAADVSPEVVDLAVIEAFAGVGSGLEAVDALRRRRPGLPVLLLTTYGEDAPLRERATIGDVAVLAMPASAQALEQALARALSAPQRQGDAARSRLRAFRSPWVFAALAMFLGATIVLRQGPPPLPAAPTSEVERSRAVELLVPRGGLAAAPRLLAWEAEPGASHYRVEILGVDDSVLWTADTPATELPVPNRELRLRAAVRYVWRVQALAADGTILAGSERAWFEIVPAAAPGGDR